MTEREKLAAELEEVANSMDRLWTDEPHSALLRLARAKAIAPIVLSGTDYDEVPLAEIFPPRARYQFLYDRLMSAARAIEAADAAVQASHNDALTAAANIAHGAAMLWHGTETGDALAKVRDAIDGLKIDAASPPSTPPDAACSQG